MSEHTTPDASGDPSVRRMLPWLEGLADPADVRAAGAALWEIRMEAFQAGLGSEQRYADTPEEREADDMRLFVRALDALGERADALLPRWVDRYVEELAERLRRQQALEAAVAARAEIPRYESGGLFVTHQLQQILSAAGIRGRLDPHLGPLVAAFAVMGKDESESLSHVLKYAGPAVASATPALLDALKAHGVWHWPSQISRALARAAEFDERVVPALREMLSDPDEARRRSAMDVLAVFGPTAAPATAQLLSFRAGSEAERVKSIYALAGRDRGAPPAEVLDLLEGAMKDESGYVRRAAAYALGELTPEPPRFVPLLIAACDQFPDLHDEGLPEAAVRALGNYGAAARAALPRLTEFLEGPVKGRTVDVKDVTAAIERVAPGAPRRSFSAARRPGSPAPDEPLFAVTHEGRQCYVDRLGRLAIETRFDWGTEFSDGRAIVSLGRATAVIDRAGDVVFESKWDAVESFREGFAAVKKNDKWGFVDAAGRVVIEPRYDSVTPFSEGLAGVESGRTWDELGDSGRTARLGRKGFIGRAGEVVIPLKWFDVGPFGDGLAAVSVGGVWKFNEVLGRETLSDRCYGYMDRNGRVVIDAVYSLAMRFSEGLAAVNTGAWIGRDRFGYIGTDGRLAVPMKFTSATTFKQGLALVGRRGRKRRDVAYVIDRNGRTVLESHHRFHEPFSEGRAAVWDGEAYGFIDLTGRLVIEPQFDQCEPFRDGLARVQRGNWFGLIDRAGQFVWGPTTEGRVLREFKSDWTT